MNIPTFLAEEIILPIIQPAEPSLIARLISNLLGRIGIGSESIIMLTTVVVTLIIAGIIGWAAYIVAKKWLPKLVGKFTRKSKWKWDEVVFSQKLFDSLGRLIVPIVLIIALSSIQWSPLNIFMKILGAWITISSLMLVSAILDGIVRVYELYSKSKDQPVKVFKQVLMIFLWIAVILIVISIFSGSSPWGLLGGLTALSAVLMLVFKDTILGFVSGIQIGSNHMIRVGDWIEMPSRRADGDVIDIGITTVKVQNWDKTITTIPTYALVSESFTNWRGMEESRGRRIKRSINIDVNSIRYLEDKDLENLKSSKLLKNYIEQKVKELDKYNANRASHLDARRLTNVGTFRGYMEQWLANNPNINQEMTHMVRQLQPGPTGLPIEIYCFSANQAWLAYENIQSDIFDHIYAILPLFDLRAYQYNGGVVEK